MIKSDFLAAIPMPALLIDTRQRIEAANDEARALLGSQLEDRHFATILRRPAVTEAVEACLATQMPQTARHVAPDAGQNMIYQVHCRFARAAEQGHDGWVLVSFEDVSHVQQIGQMRRDFVANVSHELRTPLTALMGFIETLRGAAREDPAAQDRFLSIMDTEANRMNRLIGDLLSLSRVESEERMRPSGSVDLCALLSSTRRMLSQVADGAGVTLNLATPQAPVLVSGDQDQLQQVFSNLLENAVKYGGQGGAVDIELCVLERDRALRAPAAVVTVRDYGSGIDPLHLPRLTERFYRVDNHRSREVGGTGLGLAIVKHIVNRHRGRLRIDSEMGKGSTFTVSLPLGAKSD